MSPEIQIAVIVAVPPTLAVIGSTVVGVVAARKANTKLDHITVLTNSTLTAANKRIESLEKTVRSMTRKRKKGV